MYLTSTEFCNICPECDISEEQFSAIRQRAESDIDTQGIGKQSIAKILNAEGILCPSEYKKLNGENYKNCNRLEKTSYWTYSTIKVMLQNELYIGNMVQGKKHQRNRL